MNFNCEIDRLNQAISAKEAELAKVDDGIRFLNSPNYMKFDHVESRSTTASKLFKQKSLLIRKLEAERLQLSFLKKGLNYEMLLQQGVDTDEIIMSINDDIDELYNYICSLEQDNKIKLCWNDICRSNAEIDENGFSAGIKIHKSIKQNQIVGLSFDDMFTNEVRYRKTKIEISIRFTTNDDYFHVDISDESNISNELIQKLNILYPDCGVGGSDKYFFWDCKEYDINKVKDIIFLLLSDLYPAD